MLTRTFLLAGRAIFTISNPQGVRYTFKITHKEGSAKFPPAWFVSLLTGSDNENDYTYVGMLDCETGTVRLTAKSKYRDDTLAVKVVRWGLSLIWGNKELPEGYAIHHEGKCGRCGRLLTVPSSVDSGFGPECIKMMACNEA